MKSLLTPGRQHIAERNIDVNRRTALRAAAQYGHTATSLLLLDSGYPAHPADLEGILNNP
ncbi:hypothetical protein T484DRAFT_1843494 [Baffinella frigidus]|nr:hypothetical protein T484DRAFT_1843494 [Cryptophyta sp. CCMP2293]